MRILRLVGLVIFTLAARAALAQSCPVDLSPTNGILGYRHRPTPDRCEGLYSTPVAGESLELLSFTIGRAFDPLPDHRLLITVPDVHSLGAQRVAVVARTMFPRVYYRMDAAVESAGSVQWPLGDVLLPSGIDPEKIGLVGTVRAADGNIYYVPLRISTSESALSQDGSPPVVIFRSLVDINSFVWRLYEANGVAPAWSRYGRDVRGGEPIAVTLDPPSGKQMILEVSARPVGGDFIRSNLKVFRP